MLLNNAAPTVQVLTADWILQKGITLSVLRLDEIHPVVSGNKIFKLQHFFNTVKKHKTIITFGGAYSNHLVATAYVGKEKGLQSIGIVRGEQPTVLSHTLQQCLQYGMQLKFISREAYAQKEDAAFISQLHSEFNNCTIIPEGGYGKIGALGAAGITSLIPKNTYTHICTAIGTGTTLAGILQKPGNATIIGVPVLKGLTDIEQRIAFCNGSVNIQQFKIFNDYYFGGYAKKTPELITFMNSLWHQHNLPTDFVYTAKLFFALFDKIKNNYFKPGSHILALHTGGLQGNLSLPKGSLLF